MVNIWPSSLLKYQRKHPFLLCTRYNFMNRECMWNIFCKWKMYWQNGTCTNIRPDPRVRRKLVAVVVQRWSSNHLIIKYLVYHSPQFLLPDPLVFYRWLTSHYLFHRLIPEHRGKRECSCLAENQQNNTEWHNSLYPVQWTGFSYIII